MQAFSTLLTEFLAERQKDIRENREVHIRVKSPGTPQQMIISGATMLEHSNATRQRCSQQLLLISRSDRVHLRAASQQLRQYFQQSSVIIQSCKRRKSQQIEWRVKSQNE
jgi:hypothetical protein